MEALIAAVNSYQGGVVLISHDSRLICSTQCELWVCGGMGPGGDKGAGSAGRSFGLRVETRGFAQYRRDVQTELERLERAALRRVEARTEARRVARARQLAKHQAAAGVKR